VVASTAFNPHNSAGASGAIFGMLGAYAAFLFLHRDIFGQLGSAQLRRILFVALINLGLGLSPGIDNWGHFGGLICGAALAWALGPRLSLGYDPSSGRPLLVDRRPWVYVRQSAGLSAVILVMLAVVALQFAAV
jgi:membrane associated rhomboid family serine protease